MSKAGMVISNKVKRQFIGLAKVQSEALRKMTCFNLLKAVNKIKVYAWLPSGWSVQLQLMGLLKSKFLSRE